MYLFYFKPNGLFENVILGMNIHWNQEYCDCQEMPEIKWKMMKIPQNCRWLLGPNSIPTILIIWQQNTSGDVGIIEKWNKINNQKRFVVICSRNIHTCISCFPPNITTINLIWVWKLIFSLIRFGPEIGLTKLILTL